MWTLIGLFVAFIILGWIAWHIIGQKGQHMKMYIFRDIYTGKLYKVHAHTAREAKWKVATLKKINAYNLAHVRPQEVAVH